MNEDIKNGISSNDLLLNSSLNSNSLSGSITTTTSDGSILTSLGGTISNGGWNSAATTLYDGPYIYDDCSIRISDSLYSKEKTKEILDDIMNFCDNYCVLKCEDICDGEAKSQCPLWNRLKCEKRV